MAVAKITHQRVYFCDKTLESLKPIPDRLSLMSKAVGAFVGLALVAGSPTVAHAEPANAGEYLELVSQAVDAAPYDITVNKDLSGSATNVKLDEDQAKIGDEDVSEANLAATITTLETDLMDFNRTPEKMKELLTTMNEGLDYFFGEWKESNQEPADKNSEDHANWQTQYQAWADNIAYYNALQTSADTAQLLEFNSFQDFSTAVGSNDISTFASKAKTFTDQLSTTTSAPERSELNKKISTAQEEYKKALYAVIGADEATIQSYIDKKDSEEVQKLIDSFESKKTTLGDEKTVEASNVKLVLEYLSGIMENMKSSSAQLIDKLGVKLSADQVKQFEAKYGAALDKLNFDSDVVDKLRKEYGITADPFTEEAYKQSRDGKGGDLESETAISESLVGKDLKDTLRRELVELSVNPMSLANMTEYLQKHGDNTLSDGVKNEEKLRKLYESDPDAFKKAYIKTVEGILDHYIKGDWRQVDLGNYRTSTIRGADGEQVVTYAYQSGTGLQLKGADDQMRLECGNQLTDNRPKEVLTVSRKASSHVPITQSSKPVASAHHSSAKPTKEKPAETKPDKPAKPDKPDKPDKPAQPDKPDKPQPAQLDEKKIEESPTSKSKVAPEATVTESSATAANTSGNEHKSRQDGNPAETAANGTDGASVAAADKGEGASQIE